MKAKWITLITLLALSGVSLAGLASSTHGVRAAADLLVYTDALASGWQDWSWDTTVNLSNAAPVYSGTASIAATYTSAWGGLYLHANSADIRPMILSNSGCTAAARADSVSRSASTIAAAHVR